MSTTTYNIIIVLPGTTGSTLVGGQLGYQPLEPVWPDQVMLKAINPVMGGNPSGAASLLEGQLYPGIVSGWFDPSKGYGSLAASLVGALSQSGPATLVAAQAPFSAIAQNMINQWGLPNTLESSLVIGLAYDWRMDNFTSAALLQNLLFNINNLYGSAVGNITLIGHSMGGIVCRTYLELLAKLNNEADPLFNNIKTLITLGTPHLGAPLAWDAIVDNLNISTYISGLTLSTKQLGEVETMVEDFLSYVSTPPFDSTYELLPPIESNLASSTPLQADVKFIGTPSNGNFSPFDVVASSGSMPPGLVSAIQSMPAYSSDFLPANNLLTPLSNGYNKRQGTAQYYCIYGVSSVCPTCTGVNYTGSTPTWQDVPTALGGDQIVPTWSATFGYTGPKAAPFLADVPYNAKTVSPTVNPPPPVGSVNHLQLPGSPDAQAKILSWLGIGLL